MIRVSLRRLVRCVLPLSALATLLDPSICAAQGYTAIHSLEVAEGNNPRAGLVQDSDSKLYGTATAGGEHGVGSVFKLDPDGGNFIVLHSFNTTDGSGPYASLILAADGFLYGTCQDGGNSSAGVIFKIDTNGNNFSVIHHFDGANEGGTPFGRLQISGTTLYGVARNNGANGFGTVFSMDTSGSDYAVIYGFGSGVTDGSFPYAGLLLASDGRLYGTTEMGHNGSGLGTVFGVNTDGMSFSTLHTFTGGTDGQDPQASLIEASDSFLYGTTVFGGSGGGTAFRVRKDSTTYSVFHTFSSADGTNPRSSLIQAAGGLLYGTAPSGGGNSGGTVYRMTLAGQLTASAHDFANASGSVPYGGVIQGGDFALYGTASTGGAHGVGVIYRITIPTINAISPTSGPASGGTPITLTGALYQDGATVTLSGQSATGVNVVGPMQIDATTPALPAGSLNDAAVFNPDTTAGFLQSAWMADFLDVPQSDGFHDYVEAIFRAGITAGCGGGNYCRNDSVRRDQMAVFLLKAEHGSNYLPPSCSGEFTDVPCPGTFTNWVEQLSAEGITGGCAPGLYCPANPVTRAQMAVFLLKTEHGSAYVPPDCTGIFGDVMCPSQFANWIEKLYAEGITGGCQTAPLEYCPTNPNTRGQMAVFLTKAFLTD